MPRKNEESRPGATPAALQNLNFQRGLFSSRQLILVAGEPHKLFEGSHASNPYQR